MIILPGYIKSTRGSLKGIHATPALFISKFRGKFFSLKAVTKSFVERNELKSQSIHSIVTDLSGYSSPTSCFILSTAWGKINWGGNIDVHSTLICSSTYCCSSLRGSAGYDGVGTHYGKSLRCLVADTCVTPGYYRYLTL